MHPSDHRQLSFRSPTFALPFLLLTLLLPGLLLAQRRLTFLGGYADGCMVVPWHPATRPTEQISVEIQITGAWSDRYIEGTHISCTHSGGWNLQSADPGAEMSFVIRIGGAYVTASGGNYWTGSPPYKQIVGTYDGTMVRLFGDGQLLDAVPASGPIEYSVNNALVIGAEANSSSGPAGNYALGEYRCIRLWNVALSSTEQNFFRERWTTGPIDGLVGNWQMTGSDDNELTDSGPLGLHGTRNGFSTFHDFDYYPLTHADRAFGRVTDGVLGNPIAGASIVIHGMNSTSSSATGFWSINYPWGVRAITVSRAGWQDWTSTVTYPAGVSFLCTDPGLVPLCAGGTIFETFDDPELSNWRPAPDHLLTSYSSWSVSSAQLLQSSNANGPGNWPTNSGTRLVRTDTCWEDDFYFLGRVRPGDDDLWGLEWCLRDLEEQATGYRALFSGGNGGVLQKAVDGVWSLLDEQPDLSLPQSSWQWLECQQIGDTISVSVDGVPMFAGVDGELESGRVALFCAAQEGKRWDDIALLQPPVDGVGYVGDISSIGFHYGPDGNAHTTPADLLGHPDGAYVSLGGDCQSGYPASVVFTMEHWLETGEGPELLICELGDNEPWRLSAGPAPWGPWTTIAEETGHALVDLEGAGFEPLRYFLLQDLSTDCSGSSPGVDLDAVISLRHGTAPPPVTLDLQISMVSDIVQLNWTRLPDASLYRVYRLPSPWADRGEWQLLEMTPMWEYMDWESMFHPESFYVVTAE